MAYGREHLACGRVGDKIVVAGGCCSTGLRDTSEVLSLDAITWTSGPALPTSDSFMWNSRALQLEDTFYLLGGKSGNGYLGSVFEFDAEALDWIKRDEYLMEARQGHAVVGVPRARNR